MRRLCAVENGQLSDPKEAANRSEDSYTYPWSSRCAEPQKRTQRKLVTSSIVVVSNRWRRRNLRWCWRNRTAGCVCRRRNRTVRRRQPALPVPFRSSSTWVVVRSQQVVRQPLSNAKRRRPVSGQRRRTSIQEGPADIRSRDPPRVQTPRPECPQTASARELGKQSDRDCTERYRSSPLRYRASTHAISWKLSHSWFLKHKCFTNPPPL